MDEEKIPLLDFIKFSKFIILEIKYFQEFFCIKLNKKLLEPINLDKINEFKKIAKFFSESNDNLIFMINQEINLNSQNSNYLYSIIKIKAKSKDKDLLKGIKKYEKKLKKFYKG